LRSDSRPEKDESVLLVPEIFAAFPELHSGMSTRLAGRIPSGITDLSIASSSEEPFVIDREHLAVLSRLQIGVQQLAIPRQCHSNSVRKAEYPGLYESCDSLMTNRKNVALAIRVADCVPLLLFDPATTAIAAIHAGWRGTSAEIAKNTLRAMESEFQTDPGNVLAFVGPAAGVCCYEVKDDVAGLFEDSVIARREGKMFLDLKKENAMQLLQSGVQRKNIVVNECCTICERELFYSYRRDGRGSGRMVVAICVKS
jgi:YfiH family protein